MKRASRVLYFHHYLANRTLTFLSNLLTNVNMTDIETCLGLPHSHPPADSLQQQRVRHGSGDHGDDLPHQSEIYEVPISYYGRTYEEGKKIGFRDAVDAVWYILYYNIIRRRCRALREYVQSVNHWLAGERASSNGEHHEFDRAWRHCSDVPERRPISRRTWRPKRPRGIRSATWLVVPIWRARSERPLRMTWTS